MRSPRCASYICPSSREHQPHVIRSIPIADTPLVTQGSSLQSSQLLLICPAFRNAYSSMCLRTGASCLSYARFRLISIRSVQELSRYISVPSETFKRLTLARRWRSSGCGQWKFLDLWKIFLSRKPERDTAPQNPVGPLIGIRLHISARNSIGRIVRIQEPQKEILEGDSLLNVALRVVCSPSVSENLFVCQRQPAEHKVAKEQIADALVQFPISLHST